MTNSWRQILASGGTPILDGGTGSELRRRGMPLNPAAWSALAPLTHYDLLRAVHADYIEAGADVITANTFASNRFVLAAASHAEQFGAINRRAVQAAREARDAGGRAVAIAGSISCLPPNFDVAAYPAEAEERAAYRELAERLATEGVDMLLLEMMQDTRHAALACEAAAATGLPWWLGLSCRLRADGALVGYDLPDERFATTARVLLAYAPAVVCVMHSPLDATYAGLAQLQSMAAPIVGAYPEWHEGPGETVDSPAAFAAVVVELARRGARVLGGCCGTRPAEIRAARAALHGGNGIAPTSFGT